MTTTFENDIAAYERELVEIIDKMEQSRQEFVSHGVDCLKDWYTDTARDFVKEHYEWTNRMGTKKLTDMKNKVASLVQNAATVVMEILSDDQHWWHLTRGGGWTDHRSKETPRGLQFAVYTASIMLGPILKKYGYLENDVPDFEPIVETRRRDDTPLERKKSPFDVEWNRGMHEQLTAYKQHLGRAMYLDAKLAEARKLKAKDDAATLWDEA